MLGKNNISITKIIPLKLHKMSHFQLLQKPLIIKTVPSNTNVNNNI